MTLRFTKHLDVQQTPPSVPPTNRLWKRRPGRLKNRRRLNQLRENSNRFPVKEWKQAVRRDRGVTPNYRR